MPNSVPSAAFLRFRDAKWDKWDKWDISAPARGTGLYGFPPILALPLRNFLRALPINFLRAFFGARFGTGV